MTSDMKMGSGFSPDPHVIPSSLPLKPAPHEEPSTSSCLKLVAPHERPSTTLANPQELRLSKYILKLF